MERQETAETTREPASRAVAPSAIDPRGSLLGLTGLLLILLAAARVASAEPAELPEVSAPPPAALAFVDHSPPEESVLPPIKPPIAPPPPVAPDLEELFYMGGSGSTLYRPQTTDEILAVAVALGTNPDLEPRKPFRKRSRDLFRTERPVTIGDQELLMRLRLRAKTKRAVSLEFHF